MFYSITIIIKTYFSIGKCTLDKNSFYLQEWGKNNFIGEIKNYQEILGNWYLSNSLNIKEFSKLFEKLDIYLKNGFIYEHRLYKMHVDSITDKLIYKFSSYDENNFDEIYCEKQRGIINIFSTHIR